MKRFLWRGVAQPGSALGLGPRGRMFESSRPDQSSLDWLFAFCLSVAIGQTLIIKKVF
jgi:hypothetical protein